MQENQNPLEPAAAPPDPVQEAKEEGGIRYFNRWLVAMVIVGLILATCACVGLFAFVGVLSPVAAGH